MASFDSRTCSDAHVPAGVFAVFSELTVRDGHLKGYVKLFLKDVAVYDPQQDKDKGVLQKLYEGVVGDAVNTLANVPRNEVATEAHVSGSVSHRHPSTWEAVSKLIENPFLKTVLPGLQQEALAHRRHR
jgi:hypothetical protein